MRRKNNFYDRIRSAPLDNDQGVLTPRKIPVLAEIRHRPVESTTRKFVPPPVKSPQEMHQEQLDQLKILTEAVEKLAALGVVVQGSPAIITKAREAKESAPDDVGIEMDESVFVTEVDTSSIEKGYENIAESKTEQDTELKSNLSKLRALKKGD